jgi:hypothetical protein
MKRLRAEHWWACIPLPLDDTRNLTRIENDSTVLANGRSSVQANEDSVQSYGVESLKIFWDLLPPRGHANGPVGGVPVRNTQCPENVFWAVDY